MAIKYRLKYNNFDLKDITVTLESDNYTGDIIDVIGVGGESVVITKSLQDLNESHIIPTTATINVYTDLIDVDELQRASDKDWVVKVYESVSLVYRGFVIPDGIQQPLRGAGNLISIGATCGLSLLNGIDFTWGGANWGTVKVGGLDSVILAPINFIRQVFDRTSLGNMPLGIVWSTSIKYDVDNTRDFLAGIMPFSELNSLTALFEVERVDCYWLIENIAKSAKCWVFQDRGKWHIVNLYDVMNQDGVVYVNEIPSQSSSVTAITYMADLNIDVSGTQINDDAYLTYTKPVGRVKVKYNALQTKNVLPNGSFDIIESVAIRPMYWRYLNDSAFIWEYESLNERDGYSADLNRIAESTDGVFSTIYPINLDGVTLFDELTLGFRFMPVTGFPIIPETGLIDWLKRPLRFSVQYTVDGDTYYLNENGYWSNKGQSNAKILRTEFVFNSYFVYFDTNREFLAGDVVRITVLRSGNIGVYRVDFNEYMDTPEAMTYISSHIPNSTSNSSGVLQISNVTDSTFNSAETLQMEDYFQNIAPIIQGAQLDDVIDFAFNSSAGSSFVKIPNPKVLNNFNGKMQIKFHVKSGQRYILDDVFIRVNDNQDLYDIKLNDKNSTDELEVGVSTSFSGFFLSSYKENMGNAEKFMLMSDYSGTGKTLTELYGRGYLTARSEAKKKYNGSFKNDFNFLSLVNIEGVKYIPLGMTKNLSTCQINSFTGFESRLENISPIVVHKGTEDNNLN